METNQIIEKGHFHYNGLWNYDSVCHIEIVKTALNDVVVCTELKENEGTSITNFAEGLANLVIKKYNLDSVRFLWIEHYGKESYEDTEEHEDEYSIVHFETDNPSIHYN